MRKILYIYISQVLLKTKSLRQPPHTFLCVFPPFFKHCKACPVIYVIILCDISRRCISFLSWVWKRGSSFQKCCSDLSNCRLLGSSFGYRHSWLTYWTESALYLVVPVLAGQSWWLHITESCVCPSNPNPLGRSKMLFFLGFFLFISEGRGVKDLSAA